MESTKILFFAPVFGLSGLRRELGCLPGTRLELVPDRKHDLRVIIGKHPSLYPAYSIAHWDPLQQYFSTCGNRTPPCTYCICKLNWRRQGIIMSVTLSMKKMLYSGWRKIYCSSLFYPLTGLKMAHRAKTEQCVLFYVPSRSINLTPLILNCSAHTM